MKCYEVPLPWEHQGMSGANVGQHAGRLWQGVEEAGLCGTTNYSFSYPQTRTRVNWMCRTGNLVSAHLSGYSKTAHEEDNHHKRHFHAHNLQNDKVWTGNDRLQTTVCRFPERVPPITSYETTCSKPVRVVLRNNFIPSIRNIILSSVKSSQSFVIIQISRKG